MEHAERLRETAAVEKELSADDILVMDEEEYLRIVNPKSEEYEQSEEAPHLGPESYARPKDASEDRELYEVRSLEQRGTQTGEVISVLFWFSDTFLEG